MDTITEVDVEQHKAARLHGMGGHRCVKLGTVFHDHTLIHLLFEKFLEWKRRQMVINGINFRNVKLPETNPTTYVRKTKPPPRTKTFSKNEFSHLMEHATDRLQDIIFFAIHNAIRPGDLQHLKVKDWNCNKNQLEFTQAKTGKFQSLPITRQMHKIIRRRAKEGKEFILDFTNFRFEWYNARKRAKLLDRQFRDLRRTTIDEITKFSGDPLHGQRMAGHTSMRTTLEHYVIWQTVDLRKDVRHLSEKFS